MAKQLNVNLAFTADTGKAKQQIQELQNLLSKIAYTDSTKLGGEVSNELKRASTAAKELSIHLNNAFNANTGNFDLSKLDRSLKMSGKNIKSLGSDLLAAGNTGQQAFLKLAQSIANADQPMLKLNSRMQEFVTTLKNTARWQFSSSILHGMMGAMQSAYGYAQDLNESLTDIRIVTGANVDEMARFAEEANKAAKALNTTTTDYTNASLIYFQQGLSDAEVAQRTEVTIKMANAAGESAEKVSDQLTAVWNNFYDGSKSLEYYADVMTALGAATASSTDEISEGLNKFAAIADTVGLSYEYAASALATVTATTRQSADVVGTAFKTLFARIQDLELGATLDDGTTLGKYSNALKTVGIDIKDANGGMKEMDQILNELGGKWNTLTEDTRVALAQTVAGTRQYTQLVALMDNWEYFQENLGVAQDSTGTLNEQADIYAESWEAARDRVQASAEGIYKSLLDDKFFIKFNNGIANALSGLDAFIDGAGGLKNVIISIGGIILSNFSNKIPQALDTLKYNITVLTKGASKAYQDIQKDMKSISQDLFEKYDVKQDSAFGTMIESSNKLASARTKFAQVSSKMSEAEKQRYEMELSLISAQQEEVYSLKQKNEELEKSIKLQEENLKKQDIDSGYRNKAYTNDTKMSERFMSLRENLNDDNIGDYVSLEEFRIQYSVVIDDIEKSIGEMGEQMLIAFRGGSKDAQDITEHLKSTAKAAAIIQKNLNDLSLDEAKAEVAALKDTIPLAVREASRLERVFHAIESATDEDVLYRGVDKLVDLLKECKIPAKDLEQVLKGIYGSNKIEQLTKDMQEFANNTDLATQKTSLLEKALKEFQPTHVIRMTEALGSLAGMMGNVVSITNSVKSMLDALGNPDLSGWEKMSSVFSGVAMIVPSVMSVFQSLGIVTKFVNDQANNYITDLGKMATAKAVDAAMTAFQERTSKKYHAAMRENADIIRANEADIWAEIVAKTTGISVDNAKLVVQKALNGEDKISIGIFKERLPLLLAENGLDQTSNVLKSKGIVLQEILNKLTGKYAGLWTLLGGAILIGALAIIIKIADIMITTQKEANEAIDEANKKYEEQQNKLEDLKNELQSVNDEIEKLNSQDTLDIVDQQELDKLEARRALLQAQVKLQEKLAIEAQKEQAQTIVKNWNNESKLTGKPEGLSRTTDKMGWTTNRDINGNYIATYGKIEETLEEYQKRIGYNAKTGKFDENTNYSKAEKQEMLNFMREWESSNETLMAQWRQENEAQYTLNEANYNAMIEAEKSGAYQMTNEEKVDMQNDLAQQRKAMYGEDYAEIFIKPLLEAADKVAVNKDKEGQYQIEIDDSLRDLYGISQDELNSWLNQNQDKITSLESQIPDFKFDKLSQEQLFLLIDNLDQIEHFDGSSMEELVNYLQGIEEIASSSSFDQRRAQYKQEKNIISSLKTGDTIDDDQYRMLSDVSKEYFVQMTDGTWKLIGDAETLKNTIDAINLNDLTTSLAEVENKSMDVDTAQTYADIANNDSASIQDQIDAGLRLAQYIKTVNEVYDQDFSSYQQAIDYMESIQEVALMAGTSLGDLQNNLNSSNVEHFSDALRMLGAEYENSYDDLQKYNEALNSGNESQIKMAEEALVLSIRAGELGKQSDIAGEEIEDLAKIMSTQEKYADASSEALANLAKDQLRWNRAVKKSESSVDDWTKALKKFRDKGVYPSSETLQDLSDVYGDLLDIDGSNLSENFLTSTENLELMKQAMAGSEEAYQKLQKLASEEILAKVGVDKSQYKAEMDLFMEELTALDLPNLEVGATINDEGFLQACTELVNAAGMTASQATDYLSSMGVDATVVEGPPEETKEVVATELEATPHLAEALYQVPSATGTPMTRMATFPYVTYETKEVEGTKVTKGVGLEVTSANKSSGGKVKSISSGSTGASKSGGGSKPKANKKTHKSDAVERYRRVDDQLAANTDAIEKASRAMDGLYGEARAKQMEKVRGLMAQQVELLKQKAKEAENYRKQDAEDLQKVANNLGLGEIKFDAYLNVENGEELENELFRRLKEAEDAAGDTVDEAEQERIDKAKENLENYQVALDRYDETLEINRELIDEAEEQIREQQQLVYDEWSRELELKIKVDDRDLKIIDYYMNKLENQGVFGMTEMATLMDSQAGIYQTQIKKIYPEAYKDLEAEYLSGGINKEQYLEGINELIDKNLEAGTSILELKEQMDSYYSDYLSNANEEISRYTELMEGNVEILDHYLNLTNLLGSSKDYEKVLKILNAQVDASKNSLEVSKALYESRVKQAADWEAQLKEAQQSGMDQSSEEYKFIEKRWTEAQAAVNEAQNQMLADAEKWAEDLKAVLETRMEEISETLSSAFAGEFGNLDNLNTQMERARSLQENYLTTTNKVYETNKLMQKAQQEIDKTTNTIAKQRLKQFTTETKNLQDKTKLSQFELDIQQAKYDLLLAEIALEEAQSAKNQVRLQRDSEGNFGYVYTADQNAIDEAQSKYMDMENALYNIRLEGANEYAEKYTQAMSEFHSELDELERAHQEGQFASEEEYQKRRSELIEYYNDKLIEFSDLYSTAIVDDVRVVDDAWSTKFGNVISNTETFKEAVQGYIQEVTAEWDKYNKEVDEIKTSLNFDYDLSGMSEGVDKVAEANQKLKDSLINDEDGGLIGALEKLFTVIRDELKIYVEETLPELNDSLGIMESNVDTLTTTYDNETDDDPTNDKKVTTPAEETSEPVNSTSNSDQSQASTARTYDENYVRKAYERIMSGAWGNGIDNRIAKGIAEGFLEEEVRAAQQMINDYYRGISNPSVPTKPKLTPKNSKPREQYTMFDTGGYTGNWEGSYGKLAFLHQKELVLNAKDTENLLTSMEVLDRIISTIDLYSLNSRISGALQSPYLRNVNNGDILEQHVTIEASFPGVSDRNEIEEAFNNLINKASQYANRK